MNKEEIVFENKMNFLEKPYFYTLQDHIPTQTKQISIWSSIIFSYLIESNHKEFSRSQITDPNFQLTHNKKINRYAQI